MRANGCRRGVRTSGWAAFLLGITSVLLCGQAAIQACCNASGETGTCELRTKVLYHALSPSGTNECDRTQAPPRYLPHFRGPEYNEFTERHMIQLIWGPASGDSQGSVPSEKYVRCYFKSSSSQANDEGTYHYEDRSNQHDGMLKARSVTYDTGGEYYFTLNGCAPGYEVHDGVVLFDGVVMRDGTTTTGAGLDPLVSSIDEGSSQWSYDYNSTTDDIEEATETKEIEGDSVEVSKTFWVYDPQGARTRKTVKTYNSDGSARYQTWISFYDGSGRLTMTVEPEGVKRFLVADDGNRLGYGIKEAAPGDSCSLDDDNDVSKADLEPYAAVQYTYNANDQLIAREGNGCCGASDKVLYRYGSGCSGSNWNSVVTYRRIQHVDSSDNPIGPREVELLNSYGKPVYRVVQEMDYSPGGDGRPNIEDVWIAHYIYEDSQSSYKGAVVEKRHPSACSIYSYDSSDVTSDSAACNGDWVASVTPDDTGESGLVELLDFHNASGRPLWKKVREGTDDNNTEYYVWKMEYGAGGQVTYDERTTYRVTERTEYPTAWDGTGDEPDDRVETTYSYEFYTVDHDEDPETDEVDTHVVENKTITLPSVDANHNGSGSSDTVKYHYAQDTTNGLYYNDWTMHEDDRYTYREKGTGENWGHVIKMIVDVNTDASGAPSLPDGWNDTTDDGENITTTSDYALGIDTGDDGVLDVGIVDKLIEQTNPDGRTAHYEYMAQEKSSGTGSDKKVTTTSLVRLTTSHMDGNDYSLVPVNIEVADLAGRAILTATGDPDSGTNSDGELYDDLASEWYTGDTNVDTLEDYFDGTLLALTAKEYEDGRLVQADRYHDIPDDGEGGLDAEFYRTLYQYDDLGREEYVIEVLSGSDPTTTDQSDSGVEQITKRVYDGLGRLGEIHRGVSTRGHAMGSSYDQYPNTLEKTVEFFYDEVDGSGDPDPGSGTEGVGDGNITCRRQYYGDDSGEYYSILARYDWRNRPAQIRYAGKLTVKQTHDNLDRMTKQKIYYDGDEDWTLDAGELAQMVETKFDERGREYEEIRYNVADGDYSGTNSDHKTVSSWYDPCGRLIKTEDASGLFAKTEYDTAGRQKAQYVCHDTSEGYNDADDVDGDTVFRQTLFTYDTEGRIWLVRNYQRNDDAAATGALTASNARPSYVVSWYDDVGRKTATVHYGTRGSDGAITAKSDDFDLETAGDQTYSSGAPSANSSTKQIVTTIAYDGAGRAYKMTDNAGREARKIFDALGRMTKRVKNYINGSVANDEYASDVTVEYTYDGGGSVTRVRAKNPDGSSVNDQDTYYLYNGTVDASWPTEIVYPDSSSTLTADKRATAGGSDEDHVQITYDFMGRRDKVTDQRGVEHSYGYDTAARLEYDSFSNDTVPSDVDGAVRRIGYTYDNFGRRTKVTSYDDPDGGSENITNEIKYDYYDSGTAATYHGWGLMTESIQDHAGAAGSGDPTVSYEYETGADGASSSGDNVAEYVRLSKVGYPNGRDVYHNYETGTAAPLSRLAEIADGTGQNRTIYAEYSYLGMKTIFKVEADHVTDGLELEYGGSGTFDGWDRFGHVVDQQWTDASSTTKDRVRYDYDGAGNMTYREITLTSGKDEYYVYDDLDRLIKVNRGDISGGEIADADASSSRAWAAWDDANSEWDSHLDALGNWASFKIDDSGGGIESDGEGGYQEVDWILNQTRQYNSVNEIDNDDTHGTVSTSTIGEDSGEDQWKEPVYDAAGNMIFCARPGDEATASECLNIVYDGWNRAVAIYKDDGGNPGELDGSDALVLEFRYDGKHRRIAKIVPNENNWDRTDYYYTNSWKILEERFDSEQASKDTVATTVKYQYVWGARYVDAAVCRDEDKSDGEGGDPDGDCVDSDDEHLYYCQDATFNVTALVDADDGDVVERYTYTPYGEPTVYDGSWSGLSASAYDNTIRFCGYRYDSESGLYDVRNRQYHPTMGHWTQRDPAKAGFNLYLYVQARPTMQTDPQGLVEWSVGLKKEIRAKFPAVKVKIPLDAFVPTASAKLEFSGGISASCGVKCKSCDDGTIGAAAEGDAAVDVTLDLSIGVGPEVGFMGVEFAARLEAFVEVQQKVAGMISVDTCGPTLEFGWSASVTLSGGVRGYAKAGIKKVASAEFKIVGKASLSAIDKCSCKLVGGVWKGCECKLGQGKFTLSGTMSGTVTVEVAWWEVSKSVSAGLEFGWDIPGRVRHPLPIPVGVPRMLIEQVAGASQ